MSNEELLCTVQAVGELQELQRRRAVQVMQGMLEEAGQEEAGKVEMEEREEATNGELPHALLGSAQVLPARPQLAASPPSAAMGTKTMGISSSRAMGSADTVAALSRVRSVLPILTLFSRQVGQSI